MSLCVSWLRGFDLGLQFQSRLVRFKRSETALGLCFNGWCLHVLDAKSRFHAGSQVFGTPAKDEVGIHVGERLDKMIEAEDCAAGVDAIVRRPDHDLGCVTQEVAHHLLVPWDAAQQFVDCFALDDGKGGRDPQGDGIGVSNAVDIVAVVWESGNLRMIIANLFPCNLEMSSRVLDTGVEFELGNGVLGPVITANRIGHIAGEYVDLFQVALRALPAPWARLFPGAVDHISGGRRWGK